MYKLGFYVPPSHVEVVKQEIFNAGAGKVGEYECCSWQVLGTGQYRPLAGSQPFIGKSGEFELVEEYRVELVCTQDNIKNVVEALKRAHPYEQPAYDVVKIESFDV